MTRRAAVVFDFGGVVFRWQPLSLLQQVLPAHAGDEESARALAERIFQGFRVGSDWAAFDRGSVTPEDLAARIAAEAEELGLVYIEPGTNPFLPPPSMRDDKKKADK